MVRTSLFLLLVSSHILVTYSLCTDSPSEWIPDPKDCKVFYLCSEGERLKYVCQAGTVANIQYRLCVKAGTSMDSCEYIFLVKLFTFYPMVHDVHLIALWRLNI